MTKTKIARNAQPTEQQIKATLKQVSKARMTIASFCRFFGHLILKSMPVVAQPHHGVDTAAIAPDGTVYFNAGFVSELTDAELCGLVIHEVLHPALLCWKRQGNRTMIVSGPNGGRFTLWNLAHDLSFNPEIEELAGKCGAAGKIKLPPKAALQDRFRKKSAEQIYTVLAKEAKENKDKGQGQGDGKSSPWGDPSQGGGGKGRKPDGHLDMPGTQGTGDEIGDDLRPDLSTTETGKKAAKGDKLAQQKLSNDWRVSVVAAAIAHEKKHGRGHLPGSIQKIVDGLQENKVDWRDALSKWIGEKGANLDFTYRRPSRRSESVGCYMPSYRRFGIDDVVVLWDTSGSMNGREKAILSEVQAICEDLNLVIRVICIDTQIHTDTHDVKEAIDLAGQIKGGGGSDFTPAFDLLEDERYQGVVIAFTDGYIGVPRTKPPHIKDVLWVLDAKYDTDPTKGRWGSVLHMDD